VKIPKGQWKAVNPRTDNTVAKQKKKKTRTNNDPLTVHRTHNDPLTVHRTKQLSNTNPSKKPGPLPSKIQALCPVKTRRSA
jgi:hypothetical protein